MNTTLVGRLFWKEYRYQRGLWLGIMAIVLVLQLMVWGMMPVNQSNPLATLASIGMVLSAFYALGSTAVMFAGEREDGTDTWLRILPVTSLPVCGSKIAWMLSSWMLAMAVGLATAWLLTLRNPGEINFGSRFVTSLVTHGGLMALWGILFSLVCRRVYIVIVLAGGALVATVGINDFAPGFAYFALAALIGADVILGRRWLLTDGEFALDRIGRSVRVFTLEDALATSVEPSLWWKYYRRELWLEWRQCRWAVLGNVLFVGLSLTFVSFLRIPEVRQICWSSVFGLLPLLSGLNVFRGEQYRERFRFQTNQGVTPSALWFAKQTIWIGMTILSIGLLSMFWLPDTLNACHYSDQYYYLHHNLPISEYLLPQYVNEHMYQSPWPFVWITLAFASLMYAIGQLCSLLFSRSVAATGIAMIGAVFASGWLLVAILLDVPLAISVMFPCLALLGCSLWRTDGWLTERNTIRNGLKIASVAAFLGFLGYQSWVIWRILEIDVPGPVAELIALFPAVAALVYGIAVGFALSPAGMLILLVNIAAGWWKWGRSIRKRLTFRRIAVTYAVLHLLATGGTAWMVHAKWEEFSNKLNADIEELRPSQKALDTGDLYREAEELLTQDFPVTDRGEDELRIRWDHYYFANWDRTTNEQKQWLIENEESLAVLQEAIARPECAPDDYFKASDAGNVKSLSYPSRAAGVLLRLKALEAEARGDLADAWSFHRARIHMVVHHLQSTGTIGRTTYLSDCEQLLQFDLHRWLKQEKQTPELLESAARDLIEEFKQIPSLRSSFAFDGTYVLWAFDGNRLRLNFSDDDISLRDIKRTLIQFLDVAPGEQTRAKLLMMKILQHQLTIADAIQNRNRYAYASELSSLNIPNWESEKDRFESLWNKTETTFPWIGTFEQQLRSLQHRDPYRDPYLLWQELKYIAARRTILLRLAAEWARLRTGQFPENVEVLHDTIADNPILQLTEEYENSQVPFYVAGYAQINPYWMDPMNGSTFEIDFNKGIEEKSPWTD